MGAIHVLTGPDHLSALATLSAVSDFCKSFALGVRWGIGHSTGLLVVGVVLIICDYTRESSGRDESAVIEVPDALSIFFESIVGVFMLVLGVYGFRRAYRKRHIFEGRVALPSAEIENNNDKEATSGILEGDLPYTDNSHGVDPRGDDSCPLGEISEISSSERGGASTLEVDLINDATGPATAKHGLGCMGKSDKRFSARTMAFLAGIIHGLAGPAGVLGVIPAVQLHDWKLAALYLSCFCVSSTLTMGCFAAIYGTCSAGLGRRTNLEFQIHIVSASLCILVGITWLVLLATGKMDDVFP